MTLIVCFDAGRGVTFFGKRQSADAEVKRRIVKIASGKPIYMTEYSASLFRDTGAHVRVTSDLASAPSGSIVFAECADISRIGKNIDRLVIYRWNRKYPRDGVADFYPFDGGMSLRSIVDFAGSSHERVTEEIWEA